MPQGDKGKYTARQKRKAEHIEEGYEKRGVSKPEAERRAWATVNKQEGRGKQTGGSGRKAAKKGGAGGTKKKSSSSTGSRKSGGRTRSRSSAKSK